MGVFLLLITPNTRVGILFDKKLRLIAILTKKNGLNRRYFTYNEQKTTA